MASNQVFRRCFLFLVLSATASFVVARPGRWQDGVTRVRRTVIRRPDPTPVTSSELTGASVSDSKDWQASGWRPNQPEPAGESASTTAPITPGPQRRRDDGGATAAAAETNQSPDDANSDIDIAGSEPSAADEWRPLARGARRIDSATTDDELARDEKRQRVRFVQNVYRSNLVTDDSSDFQNGTFVATLHGKRNPWLQRYAPFYYPQNPLPTQLNQLPDGTPPPQLREVHIGDTVLVPPKVDYSDQVLRTIHDAKLRSLPKPRENVILDGEEEEEEEKEELFAPEDENYRGQAGVEGDERLAEVRAEGEGNSEYESDDEFAWQPKDSAGGSRDARGSGGGAVPGYVPSPHTGTAGSAGSSLSSKPGPPYGPSPRPPPGFPYNVPSSDNVTPSPNQHPTPYTPNPPVQYSSQPGPAHPSPAPRPSVQHNPTRPTQPSAAPHPSVQHISQNTPTRPTPATNQHDIGGVGGAFSPITPRSSRTVSPVPKNRPTRPVSRRPAAPRPQRTLVPRVSAKPARESPPSPPRVYRPRSRASPRPASSSRIVERNGFSSKVKPDDVIPLNLAYGYEVVRPTTPPPAPPPSQYGQPKASDILRPPGSQSGPASPAGPVSPTSPAGSEGSQGAAGPGGYGAPRPEHVIDAEDVPEQGQSYTPPPPPAGRAEYTRPKVNDVLGSGVGERAVAASPRGDTQSEGSARSAERPGYAAPKDADVIAAGERRVGGQGQGSQSTSTRRDQERTPHDGDVGKSSYRAKPATPGGYMRPKHGDILSPGEIAGIEQSRYYPRPVPTSVIPTETRATEGYSPPKQKDLIVNDVSQDVGIRASAIQFQPPPQRVVPVRQNGYSRPRDADIVGSEKDNFIGNGVPSTGSGQPQRPELSETLNGYSRPRPADLVQYSENSLVNGNRDGSTSPAGPQPPRQFSDSRPRGYAKPKDADVLRSGGTNDLTSNLPTKLEVHKETAPPAENGNRVLALISPTNFEHREELAPPKGYTNPKVDDVIDGDSSRTLDKDHFAELPQPLFSDQNSNPSAGSKSEDPEASPGVAGFGPVRSETVIQPQPGVGEAQALERARYPAVAQGYSAPRPQDIVPEDVPAWDQSPNSTPLAGGDETSRPVGGSTPSNSLYSVDDFLRSEDVAILGAFQAPGVSRDVNTDVSGIDVTTQRAREASPPARPQPTIGGWQRRADPGPFRAQAALLDAQFSDIFSNERPPTRRRKQRPAARRRLTPTRRPLPEFGPPFAVRRVDQQRPAASDGDLTRPLTSRRRPAAPQFGSKLVMAAVAPPNGRSPQRPTVAPRGGFPPQLSSFTSGFEAPFTARAGSRVSVGAEKQGRNRDPEWPGDTW